MEKITIGQLIQLTRKNELKISRKKLSRGLCSEYYLYKIENDLCEVNLILLEILLQRLGKSPDKLEIIITNSDYETIKKNEHIKQLILTGNGKKAHDLLLQNDSKSLIGQMYSLRMESLIFYLNDKNIPLALERIWSAIQLTLSGFDFYNIDDYYLSTIEMENILFFEQLKFEQIFYPTNEIKNELNICLRYIESHFTDGEENAKIYSKCAWVLARIFKLENDYNSVISICEQAIEKLRHYSILYFLSPLLRLLNMAQENSNFKLENSNWGNCLYAIEEVKKYFISEDISDNIIFHNCYQKEYYLDSEFIQIARISNQISQEKLIEGIYQSSEPLSRIENGKASPNKQHFEQLAEKLLVSTNRYHTFIVTESFKIMELRQQIDILMMKGKYQQAEKKLDELAMQLNMNEKENAYIISDLKLYIKLLSGEIELKEIIFKERNYARELISSQSGLFKHIPTKNEVYHLNRLCINLIKNNNSKEAIMYYEMIISSIKNSKISVKYRFRSYSLIISNYAKCKQDEVLCYKLMSYSFICGKASIIPYCLNTFVHILNKRSDENTDYWISVLCNICNLFQMTSLEYEYRKYLEKKH